MCGNAKFKLLGHIVTATSPNDSRPFGLISFGHRFVVRVAVLMTRNSEASPGVS